MMQQIHITTHNRQLQQYTQDNYNNSYKNTTIIHKTTTTIHTRQLQKDIQEYYNNTHKKTNNKHTRQLQQYTKDNYNTKKQLTTIHKRQLKIQHVGKLNNTKVDGIVCNTPKTTTTIHTRQLQQYTQDYYNNTHKKTNNQNTTTIIHKRQLTTINTKHLKIQHVQKLSNTKVRQYCTQFLVLFPTHLKILQFFRR
jgi:hypothetical protein